MSDDTKRKAKATVMGAYRAGLYAGIGYLIWMNHNYVTRDRFEAERRFNEAAHASLNTRIDKMETRVDRIQPRRF